MMLVCQFDIVLSQPPWFKICDICVNSSVVEEEAIVETHPYSWRAKSF